ncbi:hypothetical protein BC830DRAFT_1158810, partial [Chytriomyces sp. MP71]
VVTTPYVNSIKTANDESPPKKFCFNLPYSLPLESKNSGWMDTGASPETPHMAAAATAPRALDFSVATIHFVTQKYGSFFCRLLRLSPIQRILMRKRVGTKLLKGGDSRKVELICTTRNVTSTIQKKGDVSVCKKHKCPYKNPTIKSIHKNTQKKIRSPGDDISAFLCNGLSRDG